MTIEELIKDQIANIDLESMVRSEVKRLISDDAKRQISKLTEEGIKKIIDTEIDIVMSKGIQTDDGWGKKETYQNFEALFKQKFSQKLNDSYEVKRTIEKAVTDRVDSLFKQRQKEVIERIANDITGTIIKKD